jgi:hypothetical protein
MNAPTRELHEHVQRRLDEIERALKFDPNPEYRRQLVREFLDLTEPRKEPS